MSSAKIKSGDKVIVLSGKDKGTLGRVIYFFPKTGKALVKGVNIKIKHIKPNNKKSKGCIITREHPIFISKLAIVDPDTGKPTRIGFFKKNGVKYRITKISKKIL